MDPMERLHVEGDYHLFADGGLPETWPRGVDCGPMDLVMRHERPWALAQRQAVQYGQSPNHQVVAEGPVAMGDFDAVWMRKDPPIGVNYFMASIVLEHAQAETLVVNAPAALRDWNEKLAALRFPELTPPTVVTSQASELRAFLEAQGGDIIVKPLDASGGFGIFRVRTGDENTGSILEQSTNLGTRLCVAQRYLPAVRQGDKRILLLDGELLCAVLRVPPPTMPGATCTWAPPPRPPP